MRRKDGVLIIAHGSRSEEWVQLVDEMAALVKLPSGIPHVVSFLELVEGRSIQDGIDELTQQGVSDFITIPLFISKGSTHVHEIASALGVHTHTLVETELAPYQVKGTVHYTSPIDDDPTVAGIVWDKLRPLSVSPAEEVIVLVGHGSPHPGFYEQWDDGLRQLAERVKELGRFAACGAAMLRPDQLREQVIKWQLDRPELTVLVVPIFLSEGYYTNQAIPKRLEGLNYRYNGQTLLPSSQLASWVERQMMQVLTQSNGVAEGI
ncbi:cobalamin biosynthesis protein CbiX [Paenibacillus sp. N1-5-1-14]|uniref:sirohydrochlorin chelatase n=1 Tax=Paenibacillus radicibacter TaxID=2972488 RepID=UPI002158DD49|nr:CbiX/SirB N-terminal domain-containing protein [Paenibacillus radicibacter]MCR8644556.1 cobalamin biosynthesis protein CbiX [Paenibacillus radicibacter]